MHESDTSLASLADWLRKTAAREPKAREFVVPEWWLAAAAAVEEAAKDKVRLDWLLGAVAWHTPLSLVHGEVREYRFRTPTIEPTINVRAAIDAAIVNPVGK